MQFGVRIRDEYVTFVVIER